MNLKKYSLFLVVFFYILGSIACNVNVKTSQLPPDIKSIYIADIENKTVSYGLVSALREALTNEFISDGRLVLVDGKTADSILNVTITKYSLEPISYDVNGVVKEYKLRIGVKIVLYSNKENKVLFEEPGIEESEIYVPQNSPLVVEQNVAPRSEDEVKRDVLEMIARDIVRRVIDGWW